MQTHETASKRHTESLGKVELGFQFSQVQISHLAQVTHFLVLDVLVDVTGPAGGGTGLPHDQDPLLPGLRIDPLKSDAGC